MPSTVGNASFRFKTSTRRSADRLRLPRSIREANGLLFTRMSDLSSRPNDHRRNPGAGHVIVDRYIVIDMRDSNLRQTESRARSCGRSVPRSPSAAPWRSPNRPFPDTFLTTRHPNGTVYPPLSTRQPFLPAESGRYPTIHLRFNTRMQFNDHDRHIVHAV